MLLQKGNILFPAITAAAADLGEGVRPHLFKGALRTPRSAQEDMRKRISSWALVWSHQTCYDRPRT